MPSKKASDNIIEKKQASVVRRLKAGAHPDKVYPALKLSSLKQQAPEGHNASLLKSQSITRQKLEEGNEFCQLKKAKVLRDKLHSSLQHQTPHRCTASTEKFQSFQKEKEFCEHTKAKVMPKKPKSSLENQVSLSLSLSHTHTHIKSIPCFYYHGHLFFSGKTVFNIFEFVLNFCRSNTLCKTILMMTVSTFLLCAEDFLGELSLTHCFKILYQCQITTATIKFKLVILSPFFMPFLILSHIPSPIASKLPKDFPNMFGLAK